MYEGNLVYDYAAREIHLFYVDLCVQGDGFVLMMERNYGSSRLMALEEFQRGSWIDARSNVFNLGRIAQTTLGDASPALAAVFARAVLPERDSRYPTVRAFADAFSSAASLWIERGRIPVLIR